MKKISIQTQYKKILADTYTPVGIYLRLRDQFRDTILLESADAHSAENARSIIAINAIGGIEIKNLQELEYKYPLQKEVVQPIKASDKIANTLWEYMQHYEITPAPDPHIQPAQGLFGYTSYEAIQFFENINLPPVDNSENTIPFIRYRLYQYVIIIHHFKSEMYICENTIPGLKSEIQRIETLIKSKDVPSYPFSMQGEEKSNKTDETFLSMVNQGIKSCLRGDVFQIVLSRRFEQKFIGDDFNVYRALRSINPSPYLFYFDYSDYKLMGSSPESQLLVKNNTATVHPIAGTFKRTGNEAEDKQLAEKLLNDPKETAEHTMLVDLARNDLSKMCRNVRVNYFKKIHQYSHVLHIVSEVVGDVAPDANPFELLANTFPAGTLSGAPKYKAMQLIHQYEQNNRNAYGGTIGFVGFDGSFNHAIIIRTFTSQNNTLYYQAGAGVVAKSNPENELQEVHNKLGALKQAIVQAQHIDY